jgi:O-antigen/teichoic acid export membrane protein
MAKKLEGQVFFPAYALLQRRDGTFRRQMLRARAAVLAMTLPGFGILAVFGPDLIELLYDDRYVPAGPFLTALAITGAFNMVTLSYGSTILAVGSSKWHAVTMVVYVTARVLATLLGYWIAGPFGMLLATALVPLFVYPAQVLATWRRGLWTPGFDAAAGSLALVIAAIAMVRNL